MIVIVPASNGYDPFYFLASIPPTRATNGANKTGEAELKLIEELKGKNADLEAQVSECFDSIAAIEQERNFYFEKLRKVVILLPKIKSSIKGYKFGFLNSILLLCLGRGSLQC